MSHSSSDIKAPRQTDSVNKVTEQSVSDKRLADALRRNLLRRKAAARMDKDPQESGQQ
jgi:hypothetical protein